MQIAAGHEKHLALRDCEDIVKICVAENRDQSLSLDAISQLVGVGVPVRLTETPGFQCQAVKRHSVENGKIRAAGTRAGPPLAGKLRLDFDEGKNVRGF